MMPTNPGSLRDAAAWTTCLAVASIRSACIFTKAVPGSGKTTLAFQFLLEGVRRGERTLYITLSETERELRFVAKRHGWSLDGITVFELVPPETTLDPSQELTVLHPAEMELSETSRLIFDKVEGLNPNAL